MHKRTRTHWLLMLLLALLLVLFVAACDDGDTETDVENPDGSTTEIERDAEGNIEEVEQEGELESAAEDSATEVAQAADEAGDAAEEAAEDAAANADEAAEDLSQAADEAGEEAAENIEEAGDAAEEAADDAADDVGDVVGSVVETAGGAMEDAGAAMADAAEDADDVAADVVETAGDAAETAAEVVVEAGDEIDEAAEEVADAAGASQDEFAEAGEELQGFFGEIGQAFGTFFDNFEVKAPDVDVEEAAQDAADTLENAGDDLAEEVDEIVLDLQSLGTEDDPLVILFSRQGTVDDFEDRADAFADSMESNTQFANVASRVEDDINEIVDEVCAGNVQIVVLDAAAYLAAADDGCVVPLAIGVRNGAQSEDYQVLVRGDIQSLEDLNGKTFCRPDSLSNWALVEGLLNTQTTESMEMDVRDLGSYEDVLQGLYEGDCDAGIVPASVQERASMVPPSNVEIRVLTSIPNVPNEVVAVVDAFPPEIQQALVSAVTAIPSDLYGWDSLQAVDSSSLERFRSELEASGVSIENLR